MNDEYIVLWLSAFYIYIYLLYVSIGTKGTYYLGYMTISKDEESYYNSIKY